MGASLNFLVVWRVQIYRIIKILLQWQENFWVKHIYLPSKL
jgi:hypothetical protein